MSVQHRPASEDRKGRVYEAPRLVRVSLKADEVLAYGCKMLGGLPALGSVIPDCGIANNCNQDGS